MPVQAAGSAAGQDPQSTDPPGLYKATQASSTPLKRKREEDQHVAAAADPGDTAAVNPAEAKQAASSDAVGASVEVEQLQEEAEQLQEEAEPSSGEDEESAEAEEPRSHPYGVQPWGNFYLSQVPEIRTAGGVNWG